MLPIRILVVASEPGLYAAGIKRAVEEGSGDVMRLLGDDVVPPDRVTALLEDLSPLTPCAIFYVQRDDGSAEEMATTVANWLDDSDRLVVLHVTEGDDLLEIAARNVSMDSLLAAVRALLDPEGSASIEYVPHDQLHQARDDASTGAAWSGQQSGLLKAVIEWNHVVLYAASARLFDGSAHDGSVKLAAIADWIKNRDPQTSLLSGNSDIGKAETAIEQALLAAEASEPLACLSRALALDSVEMRFLLLALGPELDPRYRRWTALLLDDPNQRGGTLGLFAELLGIPSDVATHVAATGRLWSWRLFDTKAGNAPAADEPLRIDPSLRWWLLGAADSLAEDPVLRPILLPASWPGASLLDEPDQGARADRLIARLRDGGAGWLLLNGDSSATWRALAERGSQRAGVQPLRVQLARLVELPEADAEEAGARLARLARLSGRPLVLDANGIDGDRGLESLRRFLANLDTVHRHAAIITGDPARTAGLLGCSRYDIEDDVPSSVARISFMLEAASGAGVHLTLDAATSLTNLFPLQIDGLEQAMRLAIARPLDCDDEASRRARFMAACNEVSAVGASGLAQRIEPTFDLDDLILPPDRKEQLYELIDNIRFASKVLEGWKFRDQLPYGLGVTALFHGPSGTGKTMAAMAVARKLGVQILRIDLSRLVSKYIGDTEKNIDRIFLEAQHSGTALLIDEADGLLSKRGEVKDAHDRYANLEVSYLLQRMEAHDGLAILTTNLRQNLDTAFLRRLRFIIDFPRPDAASREAIWRRCLPRESHELDDAMFRQLGRRIELTGGNIRQITLRAAFMAAAADTKIGPAQIARACRAEFFKLGIPPVELDLEEERRAA